MNRNLNWLVLGCLLGFCASMGASCGASTGPVTGGNASIGLGDLGATRAVSHSFQTTSAVSAGSGLRFTPQ